MDSNEQTLIRHTTSLCWFRPNKDCCDNNAISFVSSGDNNYYGRKHHLPDVTPKLVKLAPETPVQRVKPRRVQRAMSQDHVLSPVVSRRDYVAPAYAFTEDLLSADRLQSRDPLLSPDKLLSLRRADFREKSMARALSHTDMFVPPTPTIDRHHRMAKAHSHSQQSDASDDGYRGNDGLLSVSGNKRQAFASRRTHTVDHLQYIPGHHHHQYRTASKNEVTVWAQRQSQSEQDRRNRLYHMAILQTKQKWELKRGR